MRQLSFALTTPQVEWSAANLDKRPRKDVTRRIGWLDLQVGERLVAVEKSQGLRRGERVRRLAVIEVVAVDREPLERIADRRGDVAREGFPLMTVSDFVAIFCRHHSIPARACTPRTVVTRIEFRYVSGPPPECAE